MCLLSCKILHRYSCLEILKERNILLNDRTVSLRSPDSHLTREVTSPEMLSYLAQNVIMLSRASDDTFIPLVRSHDSLRNMIYYKKLYFLRIYSITPDNISGDLTIRIGRHNSSF